MVKRKHTIIVFTTIVTIIVLFGIVEPLFFPNQITTAISADSTDFSSLDSSVSHLIQNVPYVGQETNVYCSYATQTMIFSYYGINTSLHEVLYYSGMGSSLIYVKSVLSVPQHVFVSGFLLSQSPNESSFLASLYGLSFHFWFADQNIFVQNESWQQYWSYVKENISQDIPVWTGVDPYAIPHTREHYNPSDNTTHGGHSILLIGYNETNGTVCYNDPAPDLWNDAVNGTYVYISQDILRNAVENTTGTKYSICTYQKLSGSSPLSLEKRFEKAHERNILKMKGDSSMYPDLGLPAPSYYLGISGLKAFQRDLRIGITHRMTTVRIYAKLISDPTVLPSIYDMIAIEETNASQYLLSIKNSLGDETLRTLCDHDASLFIQESNGWKQMALLVLDLNALGKTHRLLGTLLLSFPTTMKMKKTVNNIISIENAIITDKT